MSQVLKTVVPNKVVHFIANRKHFFCCNFQENGTSEFLKNWKKLWKLHFVKSSWPTWNGLPTTSNTQRAQNFSGENNTYIHTCYEKNCRWYHLTYTLFETYHQFHLKIHTKSQTVVSKENTLLSFEMTVVYFSSTFCSLGVVWV